MRKKKTNAKIFWFLLRFPLKGNLPLNNFFFIIEDGKLKLRTYIHLDKSTNFHLGFFLSDPPFTLLTSPPPLRGGIHADSTNLKSK